MRHTNYYSFHGLSVVISADEPLVLAAIDARFRHFAAPQSATVDLSYELSSVAHLQDHLVDRPQGQARCVYEPLVGEVIYFDATDQIYLSCEDRVRVLCAPSQGWVRMSILQPCAEHLWLVSHAMFTIPFIEFLKRQGRYSLHAAGLCLNGKGLLLPGTSGAGKSTLTVTLLRAGFGFLGDDLVFLTAQHEQKVLAFPEPIDLTDHTASLFPELHSLLCTTIPGWHKRQARAEEIYAVDFVEQCRPAVLVFPRVANTEQSILEPMHQDEALLELVPNVLLSEAHSSQAHLSALAQLVRECDCYRLETGRDFDAQAILLRNLLEPSVEKDHV